MKRYIFLFLSIFLATNLFAQKTTILYAPDDDGTVYTSIDAATKAEKPVYRLKITKLANKDSLPEELFQLTELRELTVKGCKLCRLNQNIGKLTKLQYLNLDHNKLLRLPETIGFLTDLRTLVISRNILEELPERIGNLLQLTTIVSAPEQTLLASFSADAPPPVLWTLHVSQMPLAQRNAKCPSAPSLLHPIPW